MLEDKNQQRTSLEILGEFGLIDRIASAFSIRKSSTVTGIGDDAAVINPNSNEVVVTTDFLIEGVHFDLSFMPLKHLGYKTVAVAVSDLCAMNVKPSQILISLAMSNRFTLEAIDEFYSGVQLGCKHFDVDLIGGDTSTSVTGLIISATAIGLTEPGKKVLRSTAKVGDLIVLSGDVGSAYMGLQVLEREKQVFLANPNSQPDLSDYSYLIERQLKPEARVDLRELFAKLELEPTSMIDVSDGLASEILQICKSSKVGCRIYEDKLPIDPQLINCCEEFNIDSTTIALNGGEDYELLFTISLEDFDKVKGNPNFSIIGHIVDESAGANLITRAETSVALTARGFRSA